MAHIKVITDNDFGLNSKKLNDPKIRYGARGIIERVDGKIAILNKKAKNEYKLPGGGVEIGETPKTAFIREALEETGCNIKIIRELGTIEEKRSLDNFKQISYIFVGKVTKDTKKLNLTQKEKDEGAQVLWVSKETALELITNCMENISESKYENLYHSKFIVLRDNIILKHYIGNK